MLGSALVGGGASVGRSTDAGAASGLQMAAVDLFAMWRFLNETSRRNDGCASLISYSLLFL